MDATGFLSLREKRFPQKNDVRMTSQVGAAYLKMCGTDNESNDTFRDFLPQSVQKVWSLKISPATIQADTGAKGFFNAIVCKPVTLATTLHRE